ncbi:MAG: hypothetical protein R3C16_07510 [Hyphomonadaceae bacterium]
MAIIVCPLSRARTIARERKPSHVVSLLDPGTPFPIMDGHADERHLRLEVHDIPAEMEGLDAVCDQRIQRILDFVTGWSPEARS